VSQDQTPKEASQGVASSTFSSTPASVSTSATSAASGPTLPSLFSSLAPGDRYIALQAAASALAGRFEFTRGTGYGWSAFDGLRDYFQALGFKRTLTIQDYRQRYERGGIAKVLIDRLPEEMWDDGVFIEEEEHDSESLSEYEIQSAQLWERLSIESRLMKADKLAGLSTHSVVLIGVKEASTDLSQPLPRLKGPDDIIYLLQFAEDNAKVLSLVSNLQDERFGRPEFYELKTVSNSGNGPILPTQQASTVIKVHWTRIIHIAHGLLESDWIGTPDLQASWNDLESLYKTGWGGPEFAWRRGDMGIQWDLDPQYDYSTAEGKERLKKMDEQIEERRHNLRSDIKTSGVTAKPLAGPVDKFGSNVDTSLKLIAGTHSLPYTLLTGEELGLRAGENNRETINIVTQGRRKQFGTPLVRQLQDRLIEFGGLAKPKSKDGKYRVVWGVEEELGENEKATLAKTYADANQSHSNAGGGLIYTADEIRYKVGDDPQEEEIVTEEESTIEDPVDPPIDLPIDQPSGPDPEKLIKMLDWFETEMVK
jgi:hypothetical protein